jgi:hypothetical protein
MDGDDARRVVSKGDVGRNHRRTLALAVPTLLWPAQMQTLARLPAATPLVWVRFSSLLLILLSSFYVPAAIRLPGAIERMRGWELEGGWLAYCFFALQGARVLAFRRFRLRIFSRRPPPDEDGKTCGARLVDFSPWCW